MTALRTKLPSMVIHAYARFRRAMTLGVRAAVIGPAGEVFLVRHTYVPGWFLPGGGVEPGETIATAAARELMEEGGIRLDAPGELFGLYLNRAGSPRDHVALFVCRAYTQVSPPRLPNAELIDARFFPPDGLPAGTTDATRRRLTEIAGGPRAEEW